MKKFKYCIPLFFVFILAGCSGTNDTSSLEIVIESSDMLTSSTSTSSAASTSSDISTPSDVSENNSGFEGVIDRVAASDKNALIGQTHEFVIDEENAMITLNVDYTNYIDINTLKNLYLDIEVHGCTYEIEGKVNNGALDLTEDAYLIVTNSNGQTRRYAFVLNRTVHDLPIINIWLDNSLSVYSIDRNVYSGMEMYIDCSGSSEFSGTEMLVGQIKGRGHSSWKWDKKPYRIKLDEPTSIFGFSKNRDWILLSNHVDKSLMRNIVAYDMGHELDGFVWTPTQYPVDLFVNGQYRGVYAFGEQREITKHKVNIDKDEGVMLEVGGADGDGLVYGYDYFHTNSGLVRFITFTDPNPDKLTDQQRNYVIDYVNKADAAIISGIGYEEYIDVDSFCDWIIMQELTCNRDGCFRRSCYMTKDKGGKLKMGPIWDFDMAFGNCSYDGSYDKWFTVGTKRNAGEENNADLDNKVETYIRINWCSYLMENPDFRARIKSRWFEVRDKLIARAKTSIAQNKSKIYDSQAENFKMWGVLGYKTGLQSWTTANIGNYDAQVKYILDFLDKRAAWIDANI